MSMCRALSEGRVHPSFAAGRVGSSVGTRLGASEKPAVWMRGVCGAREASHSGSSHYLHFLTAHPVQRGQNFTFSGKVWVLL